MKSRIYRIGVNHPESQCVRLFIGYDNMITKGFGEPIQ
jgi:hypothetical protein